MENRFLPRHRNVAGPQSLRGRPLDRVHGKLEAGETAGVDVEHRRALFTAASTPLKVVLHSLN